MDFQKLSVDEINEEIDKISIKRFLTREKEYKEIVKNEVIEKTCEHCKNAQDRENIKYLIIGVISNYDFELSRIRNKIKNKVIVETLYPDEIKEKSLKQFPPYI